MFGSRVVPTLLVWKRPFLEKKSVYRNLCKQIGNHNHLLKIGPLASGR